MTYNRSEIMTTAWARTRDLMQMFGYASSQLMDVFRIELRKAWAKAKAAANRVVRSADEIRFELHMLENKSFRANLSDRRAELVSELREAA